MSDDVAFAEVGGGEALGIEDNGLDPDCFVFVFWDGTFRDHVSRCNDRPTLPEPVSVMTGHRAGSRLER